MKRALFLAVAVTSFGLSGCAGSGHKSDLANSGFNGDIDYAKMATISHDARSRGYDIVWVNPPLKDKPANSYTP